MKSFTMSAAVAALLAATTGAQLTTVTVATTPCPGSKIESKTFNVVVNTVGVVKIDAPEICGLVLKSSASLPLDSISCQAFKDADGKTLGSAVFTAAKPALISTTPVGIESVWCRNAQFNGGSSSLSIGTASSSASASSKSVPTITLGAPIRVSETATARLAVPTGNATVTVPGGGGVQGNQTTFTGGASGMGVGLGAGLVGVFGLAGLVL